VKTGPDEAPLRRIQDPGPAIGMPLSIDPAHEEFLGSHLKQQRNERSFFCENERSLS
jgi:hypothetical protein